MTSDWRLSCVPMIYFKAMVLERTMLLEEWFPIAADLGVMGTEIHDRSLRATDSVYLDHIAEAVRDARLKVSQFVMAPDLCHPDPDKRAEQVGTVRVAVDIARRLSATCVRVTAGQAHQGVSRGQAIAWAVASLREVLPYAEANGALLALENHFKDYFWSQSDITQVGEVFLTIVRELADTPLRVNFDTGNPLMIGEDPAPLLQAVRDRVVHVHCADRFPGKYEHTACGEGAVDFPSLFRLLKEINYAGWLSVEYNGSEGLAGLKRSLDYVRRTWDGA